MKKKESCVYRQDVKVKTRDFWKKRKKCTTTGLGKQKSSRVLGVEHEGGERRKGLGGKKKQHEGSWRIVRVNCEN